MLSGNVQSVPRMNGFLGRCSVECGQLVHTGATTYLILRDLPPAIAGLNDIYRVLDRLIDQVSVAVIHLVAGIGVRLTLGVVQVVIGSQLADGIVGGLSHTAGPFPFRLLRLSGRQLYRDCIEECIDGLVIPPGHLLPLVRLVEALHIGGIVDEGELRKHNWAHGIADDTVV